jgi:hypothetical protein
MIASTNNIKLFFYYFNLKNNLAYKDLSNPILFSIATFRKWNKKNKIYVLDVSPIHMNWGDFPDILNFEVIRKPLAIKNNTHNETNSVGGGVKNYLLLKPKKIYEAIKEKTNLGNCVMVSDADVFFIKNPIPLEANYKENFCIHKKNTGFYYFQNGKKNIEQTFRLWLETCEIAINNLSLQNDIKKITKKDFIQEETVWEYIRKIKNVSYQEISDYENFWFNFIYNDKFDLSKVKNIHYCIHLKNPVVKKEKKGLFCMYIKELRSIIEETFQSKLYDIIGNFDCEEFSIKDKNKIKWLFGLD